MSFPEDDPDRRLKKRLAALMTAQGFYQAINYSFVNPKHFDMIGIPTGGELRRAVTLMNPLAEDQSVMRTMLLPGLLENLRRNVNYQSSDVRLFEVGKVFIASGNGQPREHHRLAAVLCGRRQPGAPMLYDGGVMTDIYDAKGVVEQLLDGLRLKSVNFVGECSGAMVYADPAIFLQFRSGDRVLGHLGKVAGPVLKAFAIKQEVFFVELDLDLLVGALPASEAFVPLPKFPGVKRDLAVLVPENVPGGEMVQAIVDSGEVLVEHVEIFDVFRGRHINQGLKSIGITITYRAADQTLEDEAVDRIHTKITEMILSRFNGQLREV
jgi:phenylalanyl-tRNA synthetase beta chain